MKRKLKEVISRVETWSEQRQQDATRLLLEMEAQARSQQVLSQEQVTEVERRRLNSVPQFLSLTDIRSRFPKRGA